MKNEQLIKTALNLLLFCGNGSLNKILSMNVFPNRNIFFLITSIITKILKGNTINTKKFLTQIMMFYIPIHMEYLSPFLKNLISFEMQDKILVIIKIALTTFYLADQNLESKEKIKNQFSSILIAVSYFLTKDNFIQNIIFTIGFMIWNSNYVHEIKEFENSWFYQYATLFAATINTLAYINYQSWALWRGYGDAGKYIFHRIWLKEILLFLNNFIFIYHIFYVSILPMILEGFDKGKNIEYDGTKAGSEKSKYEAEKHEGKNLFGISKPSKKTRKVLRNITLATTAITCAYSTYKILPKKIEF